MKTIETIGEMRSVLGVAPRSVGLVPTMGFLHKGHMSLVRQAREQNKTVVVSLFVNPSQFEPYEDYDSYPRDHDSDLQKLKTAGVDLVFAPDAEELYPQGFDTSLDVGHIGTLLEGKYRTNHFNGVGLVVCKLLSIVRPGKTYFGQKDAQQCVVVQKLNSDLNLGTEIVIIPTVREKDGLAISSRNIYLSDEERKDAALLYQSLKLASEMWRENIFDVAIIKKEMTNLVEKSPLVNIEYIGVSDPVTLEELSLMSKGTLVSIAAKIGKARLIDNITLGD